MDVAGFSAVAWLAEPAAGGLVPVFAATEVAGAVPPEDGISLSPQPASTRTMLESPSHHRDAGSKDIMRVLNGLCFFNAALDSLDKSALKERSENSSDILAVMPA